MSNFDIAIKSATKNYKKAIKELEQTGKIDEQHTCAIIKNAQIRDEELLLRISPSGPFGDLLTEALDTPGGPAFFDMRALYSHVGDELITLKIVTWDLVSGKP